MTVNDELAGSTASIPAQSSAEVDRAALIRATREQYRCDVARGFARFFEPARTDCPWCASPRLKVVLHSPDLIQHKPGRFTVVSCRGCGHTFQNPQLSVEGLEYYYRDFYDGVGREAVENGFELGRDGNLARARHLKEFFADPPPQRWLDIGTGYGHFCRDAREVFPTTRFEGLDMGVSVQTGKERGWLDEAHRGFLPDLAPGLAGQFDVVSMHHYLEHTRDPRVELDAAVSLLAPGGVLMIEVPNPESLFGRLVGRWWFPWLQPQHLNFVTRTNLMQALVHRGVRPVAEIRGASHIPVDVTFLSILPMLAWGPYPGMPWTEERTGVVGQRRQRRFDLVVKAGPHVHKAVQPLERARTRIALATDRGNTFRVLAQRQI
ncbi:MAG: class I SAM-dependent methyltransferase [Sporichthyaceae bacterium]